MKSTPQEPNQTNRPRLATELPAQRLRIAATRSARIIRSSNIGISAGELTVAQASRSTRKRASSAAQSTDLVRWLQSGSNLDFCVLALCSCVLSALCHHTGFLSLPTPTKAASPVPPAQVDFTLKASLFIASPKIEEESES